MPESLPEHIEDAVLEILEGDDARRNDAIRALIEEHPRYARAIRNWLVSAGVLAGDWHGTEDQHERGDRLPRHLGDYILLEVLGRGGFGTVYRAEQQQPIRRPVAIKVLNPGMDSREVLARFAAEREALNRMDHPGIARLLDAGSTPEERPYFVMELVDGPPLATYCRREMLPLRRRIELFLKVCDAMQHAHQKQVLHRDLSSNNVLVATSGDEPQPKIIDFGIAKSLADPLLQGGALTFQGTLMGTPEFMSPEQAAGRARDIDTRTDVYSLGVQLYELLTDQLPIPGVVLRAQGVQGMAHVIATYEPARASEIAPKPRRAQLRGDLDNILQKALAKDREDRYADVGELARDLRRYLADEPIEVTAPTTWYRLRKFVRRNKAQSLAFGIAGVLVLTTLLLLVVALDELRQEAALKQAALAELREKADAGFRLLANEDRIAAAQRAERHLPPPWPQHLPAYRAWQHTFTDLLADSRAKVTARLAALAEQRNRDGGTLRDEADRHLERALTRLKGELDRFLGHGGLAEKVRARLAWGERHAATPPVGFADAWQRATAAVRASDGEASARAYAGLQLPVQPGLLPLGCHPRTKLWEFLDLRTHVDGHPLPSRDPASGDLRCDAETGIVFALLPGARVTVGARRNQPGMERNDDLAQPDECNDETVTLDAYLIARTELTVGQFARLTGQDLADIDPRLPMTNVDWPTARDELRRFGMALPTEVQWEYACRAGTTTPWCWGDDPEAGKDYGWFSGQLRPVGQLRSNHFGLCDVHGNAAEWCLDEKLPYDAFAARNGDGLRARPDTADDARRVVRGGSVATGVIGARSTARDRRAPDRGYATVGVRPVRRISR